MMTTDYCDLVKRLRERANVARGEKTATALGDALHFEEAADAITALKSESRPLIEFARWAIQEGSWVSADIPGDVVQDKAEELGLIIRTKYDPEIHGESDIAEPGDDWYDFGPLIAEQDAKP